MSRLSLSRLSSTFSLVLCWLALVSLPAGQASAGFITIRTIDSFSQGSTFVETANTSVSETFLTSSAVGFNRTFSLNALGGGSRKVFWGVDEGLDIPSLSLSSPTGKTPTYSLLWGGDGGTAGLGGINFNPGANSLSDLKLSYSLLSIDQSATITWTFTDTENRVASYAQALTPKSSSTDPETILVALSEFTNAEAIDWSSINFIKLSGGGVSELDFALTGNASIVSAVPEPTGLPLIVGLLVSAGAMRRRR